MTDPSKLLSALKPLTDTLIDDLRERTDDVPEVGNPVRDQYQEARAAGRTDRSFEEWREDLLAQVAVGWVLGTVFIRFCEDNDLTSPPLLSGPGGRRDLARDHRADWLARHPALGDREWLQEVFRRYRDLPGLHEVFGDHNPLWQFGPTADGARALLELWWEVDVETGQLVRDFTDPALETRFLGDLYQDLSDHAKKYYALLQTPRFVEEFILDRTLDPAMETFGLEQVKIIDPTCGSGHFLLGAFDRLFAGWQEREPATSSRELAQRALKAIHGVDLNPFAVAISRFRLLLTALKASDIRRLEDAPDFRFNLAVGDSLIHGRRTGHLFDGTAGLDPVLEHRYPTEDAEEANRILESGQYHAVVGNPPYITVKEPALRNVYRELYDTAYMQYSLAVPFTERFFDLAVPGRNDTPAGFVGMITANSFMKRQFGKKLIEEFLIKRDLTHIIDTSGAYIPGHGTPTVILFAQNQRPQMETVRAVLGIRGEPGRPKNPARGKVWSSIVGMLDQPGEENDFISVEDALRVRYSKHPWSLQGGAAPEVRKAIESRAEEDLGQKSTSIGFASFPGLDDAFVYPGGALNRSGLESSRISPFVRGDVVRDWHVICVEEAFVPFGADQEPVEINPTAAWARQIWPLRVPLGSVKSFGNKTRRELGEPWWTWYRWVGHKYDTPLSITFAFVATHNHFVLDRGGKVFNRSAPVIKLPEDATEDDHLRLLGLLNSSTACFWMKQVFHGKGQGGVGQESRAEWEEFLEFDGTKLQQFPIPSRAPLQRAKELDALAQELEGYLPARFLKSHSPSREGMEAAKKEAARIRARMVALQEELDWECYHLYGLTDRNLALSSEEVPALERGQRAFEIALARAMKEGRSKSTWFKRHDTTPITQLPSDWPHHYREAVDERLTLIAVDRKLRLLERPEYKRRWNWDEWDELEREALRDWLLNRLEALDCWKKPELQTVGRLADHLRGDPHALEAARLLSGRPDVDLEELMGSLVQEEAVPAAAAYRFKPSGMRKRREWERVWELQRKEDEIEARTELPPEDPGHLSQGQAKVLKKEEGLDRIPVPPKYKTADFRKSSYWKLRGRLDVPKERFISYPATRIGADGTAVVGWAGWDHLEQATALAGQYQRRKDEGAESAELMPLLVGLDELVPWLLQWHNEVDPTYGERMGEFFRAFVDTEVRSLGLTPDDLRSWTP